MVRNQEGAGSMSAEPTWARVSRVAVALTLCLAFAFGLGAGAMTPAIANDVPSLPAFHQPSDFTLSACLARHESLGDAGQAGSATLILNALKAGEVDTGAAERFGQYLERPSHLTAHQDVGPRFRIHYAPSGPDTPAGPTASDYLEIAGAALQQVANTYHADEQKWPEPLADRAGGDERIDLYVVDLGPGVYGYSLHEDLPAGPGKTGFMVIDNDFAGLAGSDLRAMLQLTIAHEYHHLIQFGYGYDSEAGWFMEQLATMEEGYAYPQYRDRERYLPALLEEPYRPLDLANGSHEYGSWLWPEFLQRRFGWDLLRRAWEIWRADSGPMIDALDRALEAEGSRLDEAFLEWTLWNAGLGRAAGSTGYGDALASEDRVGFEASLDRYPVLDVDPDLTRQPDRLGASYLRLRPQAGSADNVLQVEMTGCASLCGVRLLVWSDTEPVAEVLVPEVKGGQYSFTVQSWGDQEEAVLVIANGAAARYGCDYSVTAVTRYETATVPDRNESVVLFRNTPNPFEPFTLIEFEFPETRPVRLSVYDAQGRRVVDLFEGEASAGRHALFWRGTDERGMPMPAGLYYGRLESGDSRRQLKLVLMR